MEKKYLVVLGFVTMLGCAHRQQGPGAASITALDYTESSITSKKCAKIVNYGGAAECFESEADALDTMQEKCETSPSVETCGKKDAMNYGKLTLMYRKLAAELRRCQKGASDPCAELAIQYEAAKERAQKMRGAK